MLPERFFSAYFSNYGTCIFGNSSVLNLKQITVLQKPFVYILHRMNSNRQISRRLFIIISYSSFDT